MLDVSCIIRVNPDGEINTSIKVANQGFFETVGYSYCPGQPTYVQHVEEDPAQPDYVHFERIPAETWSTFSKYEEAICRFCADFRNIKEEDGEVTAVFCKSCRSSISMLTQCKPAHPGVCRRTCWVDELGRIAEKCNSCDNHEYHQNENYVRRTRRRFRF